MGKIVRRVIDPDNPPPLTQEQKARLKALTELPDSEIDYSDISPLDDAYLMRPPHKNSSPAVRNLARLKPLRTWPGA